MQKLDGAVQVQAIKNWTVGNGNEAKLVVNSVGSVAYSTGYTVALDSASCTVPRLYTYVD